MSSLQRYYHGKTHVGGHRGGEVKMEYILGAALAVIIVGSLVLMIAPFFRGSKSQGSSTQKWHYQCQACQGEWDASPADIMDEMKLDQQNSGIPGGGDPQLYRPDCPLCGAKKSSIRMIKCPKCGRWFVTDEMKQPRHPMAPPSVAPQVCPYCGTDRREWIRKKAIEARKHR